MNKLYPLKFHPILKEKLWGGGHLKSILNMDFGKLKNSGEAWLLSGLENNESVVTNGWLKGNDISELTEIYMDDLVGEKVFEKYNNEFPLLFKLIDAKEDLSVQVHPNDAMAKQKHKKNGKTEMWYILKADKDSKLISGFEGKIDEDILKNAILDKKLPKILHYEEVEEGDVFFIPAGRVHAIGKGIVLAEIQQSSDVTYRLYDWDRVDEQGKTRPLHITDSMQAIEYNPIKEFKTKYSTVKNNTVPLVECPQFVTNIIEFSKPIVKNFETLDSFVVYFCTAGKFEIKYENQNIPVKLGEVVLIPNIIEKIELYPEVGSKMLEIYVP